MEKTILLSLLLLIYKAAFAQDDFGIPDEVCPGEALNLTSPTDNSLRHEWDFCTGDLLDVPEASIASGFINGGFRPEGMEAVYDEDSSEWFGFITNVTGKNLIRVEFGSSLDNTPTYVNLGVVGNLALYDEPNKIRIIKDKNGIWVGFVVNNGASAGGSITKLIFGTNLRSVPTASLFDNFSFPQGLQLIKDDGSIKMLVTDYPPDPVTFAFNTTRVTVLDFENGNLIESATKYEYTYPVFSAWGFSILKEANEWKMIITGESTNKHLNIIDFGTSLTDLSSTLETNTSIILNNVRNSFTVRDGNTYITLALSLNGNIYRLNYGSSININPNVENLGNFGLLGTQQLGNRPSIAFDIVRDASTWYAFAINRHPNNVLPFNESQLIRLKFPNNCNALTKTSTEINPQGVRYILSGSQVINLRTLDTQGNLIETFADAIEVIEGTVGNFQVQNQCLGEETQVQNLSLGSDNNVAQWNWTVFDTDGTSVLQTSNAKNFNFNFPAVGEYPVRLEVENISGCTNDTTKMVGISNAPVADFEIEDINCDNFIVDLKDLSVESTFGINKRVWTFGDGTRWIATPFDATEYSKTYATEGMYNITLTVSDTLRGCSSSTTKTITFRNEDKPLADFSWTEDCAGSPVLFVDDSTLPEGIAGEIGVWSWDFAGLGTSNMQNPSFIFPDAGTYEVRLTVYNIQGCSNTISQNISIRESTASVFVASSTEGVVPFRVEFQSNNLGAQSYLWDFGDGSKSTEVSPSHTYTKAGRYEVAFQAFGENGCGRLATTTIDVVENPLSSESSILNQISVYPNPTSSILNIDLPQGIDSKEVQIQIADLSGKLHKTSPLESTREASKILDLSVLNTGLYLLKIRYKRKEVIKKIIKLSP